MISQRSIVPCATRFIAKAVSPVSRNGAKSP